MSNVNGLRILLKDVVKLMYQSAVKPPPELIQQLNVYIQALQTYENKIIRDAYYKKILEEEELKQKEKNENGR